MNHGSSRSVNKILARSQACGIAGRAGSPRCTEELNSKEGGSGGPDRFLPVLRYRVTTMSPAQRASALASAPVQLHASPQTHLHLFTSLFAILCSVMKLQPQRGAAAACWSTRLQRASSREEGDSVVTSAGSAQCESSRERMPRADGCA